YVEPDQVLVPLPGRDLEIGDLHPLLHCGRDGDRRLRVPVAVYLPLQPGKRLLRLDARPPGLAEADVLAGHRMGAGVNAGPEAARGHRLNVAAAAARAGRHRCTIGALVPRDGPV